MIAQLEQVRPLRSGGKYPVVAGDRFRELVGRVAAACAVHQYRRPASGDRDREGHAERLLRHTCRAGQDHLHRVEVGKVA